jgi:hypothetical protein
VNSLTFRFLCNVVFGVGAAHGLMGVTEHPNLILELTLYMSVVGEAVNLGYISKGR